MALAHLSTLLNKGRGLGTETCEVDNMFPPDDLGFGSYTNTNCGVMCDSYLDV